MRSGLARLLERGLALFDGAMGTELFDRGVAQGTCLEALNLSDPSRIAQVHRDYIAAGADVIETNTFGANRFSLGEHYLEQAVREVNRLGARIAVDARNASGSAVLVAGSVGPLGRPIEPVGAIKRSSAERIFREQIEGLVEGGVDLLVLETFTALNELELVAGVVGSVSPDLPFIAQLSFDDDEANPGQAARALVDAMRPFGPAAIGFNCGSGPAAALKMARHLVHAGAPAVSAMPNAGLPQRLGGRLVYPSSPDYFADYAARLLKAGVRALGGCCGTGPRHVAAMRARLHPGSAAVSGSAVVSRPQPASRPQVQPEPEPGAVPPTRLAAQLESGRFVFSVELNPPRGIDPRNVLEGARMLSEAGIDFANVTDSAMARLRMGVLSCAALVQQQVGLEAIAHFTCRDRNVMAIQSELIGAHALGIRNVLALRGDPPLVGDYPHATPVWDVNSVGLITILAGMNRGLDANGAPIGERATFHVGAVVNPAAQDFEKELRLLRRKIAAGARFIVSNPVYDRQAVERLEGVGAEAGVPVLAGVMPLVSVRHAEYLHHEVPGIQVPEEVRRRLAVAGDRAAEVGIELAVEFLEAVRSAVRGAYIIPGPGRYELATRLVARTRELLVPSGT